MDKRPQKPSKSPQCRYPNPPSFSSSLLDSIYRSIDNNDDRRARKPPNIPELTRSRNHPSESSDNSSYSGLEFSSSESEPISKRSKKERFASIRARFLREPKKGRDPVSPASRLANFLNSLFAAKSKGSRNEVTACSSYTRSCMSKAERGKAREDKRSVRFCPVSVIVDEDCRPCGHKCVYGEERPAVVCRRIAVVEDEEDAGSDSSSDLFELENLGFVGGFRDELPVYETTRIGSYSASSRSLLL